MMVYEVELILLWTLKEKQWVWKHPHSHDVIFENTKIILYKAPSSEQPQDKNQWVKWVLTNQRGGF